MYSESFRIFVREGLDKYFIGTGNPNAKILFIGKESAIAPTDTVGRNWYLKNATEWKCHLDNDTEECYSYTVDENHPLRKNWGKNTWSKYQLLSDYIWNKQTEKYRVEFLQSIFTTEINDSPAKTTSAANKSGLN